MSLHEKMYNVMNESEAIEKSMTVGSGRNSYKAVSEKVILNMVKPLLKKHKLIVFPIKTEMNEITTPYEKLGYNGAPNENKVRMITQLKVTFKIVDIESGESEEIIGVGSGADPQDKGAGKAFTYALKSALSKTFMLFSGEDTDNTHSDDIGKDDKKEENKKPPKTIDNIKAKALMNLITETETDVNKVLANYHVSTLNEMDMSQYMNAVKYLEKKRK